MARLACRRREQQSERGDGGERGKPLPDRRVRATRSVLEEIPPSNSGCFECISSRLPAHVADSFVLSRGRRLLTLACGLTPRPKGGETGDRRDPSPGLRVGASNSHSRSSLTARPRLFEGHHSLSSVEVAITATAALQNTA